ncbi:MAG: nucleotidyltransferase family protein [Eubacteriales bacterium]|nr:nucleotidyltransferase family protein [Eubacteriales bacterium]
MKAFLLAAGLGTRLRPLTETTPKCLIPVCGKPLLAWWMELFLRHGVDTVLVNTHYLSAQVRAFLYAYNAAKTGVRIVEAYEPQLLGSGGTIKVNRAFIGADESFLICNADNLTDIDLSDLMTYHNTHTGVITMALFRSDCPRQCGIAALDSTGRITEFTEKPEAPVSNLANAGVYIARKELFMHIPENGFCDLGKDVLPRLIGRMYGYEMHDYLIDIGTLKNLEKARGNWAYDHL